MSTIHIPPSPFNPSDLTLITQGAEALVYKTTFLTPSTPTALKIRPPKTYRHASLDARLTRARILAEARVLVRCAREGVRVPAVLGADWEKGWLALEWIAGRTVRHALDGWLKAHGDDVGSSEGLEVKGLMGRMGKAIAQLHGVGVVHGDLTTSNVMVESEEGLEGDVVVIDFGLAVMSVQEEDRAVDLYVLERAFVSTHPQAEGLFGEVLRVYADGYKGAKGVVKKLDEVRQRGRKKSMLG
ncbi:serine/threonine-protein kinase bud32 [Microthyrium microscopicum]|uniref:EKC/KEOPS complex subunit BUD32 n=1 Tax=Microthyrium microscopicum TaxID=703497 RepID=A0A6A6UHK7_9PEZI|nr:serine/threonine-protein kinase bud32 [Microthyrium microscopicum]